jgi:molecular chaperone GrpE
MSTETPTETNLEAVAPDGAADVTEIPVEVEAPSDGSAALIADLEAKLATAQQEVRDAKDKFLRAAADTENQRKRGRRDVEDAKHDTRVKVLKEILPVLDNLERAVDHASTTQTAAAGEAGILEGLRLVMRQFATAFERLDVTAIVAEGQPFDPNLHEAISQQETADAAAGTVLSVLQRGYKSGDKLLRPALVVVAKAKA